MAIPKGFAVNDGHAGSSGMIVEPRFRHEGNVFGEKTVPPVRTESIPQRIVRVPSRNDQNAMVGQQCTQPVDKGDRILHVFDHVGSDHYVKTQVTGNIVDCCPDATVDAFRRDGGRRTVNFHSIPYVSRAQSCKQPAGVTAEIEHCLRMWPMLGNILDNQIPISPWNMDRPHRCAFVVIKHLIDS